MGGGEREKVLTFVPLLRLPSISNSNSKSKSGAIRDISQFSSFRVSSSTILIARRRRFLTSSSLSVSVSVPVFCFSVFLFLLLKICKVSNCLTHFTSFAFSGYQKLQFQFKNEQYSFFVNREHQNSNVWSIYLNTFF